MRLTAVIIGVKRQKGLLTLSWLYTKEGGFELILQG